MKVVFYKNYELFSILFSYTAKYSETLNLIILENEELDLISSFLEFSKIKFSDSRQSSEFILDAKLLRILHSIMYFCENGFSIKYFFEIISLVNSNLSLEFLKFFEKNIIDTDLNISEILGFKNLEIFHQNLFFKLVDWCKNLELFFNLQEKKTFAELFETTIDLINKLLFIFTDNIFSEFISEQLLNRTFNFEFEIMVGVYFEFLKLQKIFTVY